MPERRVSVTIWINGIPCGQFDGVRRRNVRWFGREAAKRTGLPVHIRSYNGPRHCDSIKKLSFRFN